MRFKLTTLNLYGHNTWKGNDWKSREAKIIDYLLGEDPDVIALQEVVLSDRVSKVLNTAQIVNQTLGYRGKVFDVTRQVVDPADGPFREGLAILSKHDLISSGTYDLRRAAYDPHTRFTQTATLDIGGREVAIENVHYSLAKPGPNFAKAQIRETFVRQAKYGTKNIHVGDFQLDNVGEVIPEWRDQYVASTDSGPHITQWEAVGEDDVLEDRCPDQAWALKSHYRFIGGVALSPRDISDHCGASYVLDTIW